MRVNELWKIPVLAPNNASTGVYMNGQVYLTEYGKIYTFTNPNGETVRISRKSIYHLVYQGERYIAKASIDDLERRKIQRMFVVDRVDGRDIHLATDVFVNGLP